MQKDPQHSCKNVFLSTCTALLISDLYSTDTGGCVSVSGYLGARPAWCSILLQATCQHRLLPHHVLAIFLINCDNKTGNIDEVFTKDISLNIGQKNKVTSLVLFKRRVAY